MLVGFYVLAGFVMLLVACAPTRPVSREAAVRRLVRRDGFEVIVIADGRTYYFENRLPHCLAYSLTGEWGFAIQEALLRASGHGRYVGVLLHSVESLPGTCDLDPVSRAIAAPRADVEKDFGQAPPSTVVPFPAARPGAVLLRFEGTVKLTPNAFARLLGGPWGPQLVGKEGGLPKRVLLPFPTGFITVVTVFEEADARQVLDTLEMTDDPQCWYNTLRQRFPQFRWKYQSER
jgi:hypothetical protein